MNTCTPPHEPDDPMAQLHAIETALLAARTKCPHCYVVNRMLPGPGSSWLVEEFHQDGCPIHEDTHDGGGVQ